MQVLGQTWSTPDRVRPGRSKSITASSTVPPDRGTPTNRRWSRAPLRRAEAPIVRADGPGRRRGRGRLPLVRFPSPWPPSPTSSGSSSGSSNARAPRCSGPGSRRCSSSTAWSGRWSAPGSHQGSRTVVPGRYRVRLEPGRPDRARAGDRTTPSRSPLASPTRPSAFARAHAYHVPARPVVVLVADPSLARGQVEVDVGPVQAARSPVDPQPGRASPSLATGPARSRRPPSPVAAGAPVADWRAGGPTSADGPVERPGRPSAWRRIARAAGRRARRRAGRGGHPRRRDADAWSSAARRRPPTRALLRVCEPDGTERTIEVDGTPLDLGRSADNRLVLADPAGLAAPRAAAGAARGARLHRPRQHQREPGQRRSAWMRSRSGLGDRVQVGDTVLVVETLPG